MERTMYSCQWIVQKTRQNIANAVKECRCVTLKDIEVSLRIKCRGNDDITYKEKPAFVYFKSLKY